MAHSPVSATKLTVASTGDATVRPETSGGATLTAMASPVTAAEA